MARRDVGELVVPVGLPIKSLLFEPCDGVVLRLVVHTEVSRLTGERKPSERFCWLFLFSAFFLFSLTLRIVP